MKKGIITSLILSAALAVLGAACSQTANVNTSSTMDHNSMAMDGNSSTVGMSDTSSPNAALQPYDLQFIDTMSAHHQAAVEMATVAFNISTNEELKGFAKSIVTAQNKEIQQMNDWRGKWFAGKPAAMNMEMPGMSDSLKSMTGESVKKWAGTSGKAFDVMFLDMMTKHHTGAVKMATEAPTKAEHEEIKTLAQNIITAQEAEIKQMADWKSKWSK